MKKFEVGQKTMVRATGEVVKLDYVGVYGHWVTTEGKIYPLQDLSPLPSTVKEMVEMWLRLMGADGLVNKVDTCCCSGTMMCARNGICDNTVCVPAKLVNGELVPMG
jgi:hypothetical protein